MGRKPTPDLASALAAMKRSTGRGRGRKSDMYRWMDVRYEALVQAFAKDPPSWTGLAKFFTEAGMVTADGLPQTPASVRSTWMRLDQSRTRRKAIEPRTTEPEDVPPTPATRIQKPASPVSGHQPDDGPDFDFGSFVKERP